MREQVYPALEQSEGEMVSVCSLTVGAEVFGIDTMKVREVLGAWAMQKIPLAPAYIAGVIPNRGEVLTTVSLRALLGLEERCRSERGAGAGRRGCGGAVRADGGCGGQRGDGEARRRWRANPSTLEARGKVAVRWRVQAAGGIDGAAGYGEAAARRD